MSSTKKILFLVEGEQMEKCNVENVVKKMFALLGKPGYEALKKELEAKLK